MGTSALDAFCSNSLDAWLGSSPPPVSFIQQSVYSVIKMIDFKLQLNLVLQHSECPLSPFQFIDRLEYASLSTLSSLFRQDDMHLQLQFSRQRLLPFNTVWTNKNCFFSIGNFAFTWMGWLDCRLTIHHVISLSSSAPDRGVEPLDSLCSRELAVGHCSIQRIRM